MKLEYKGLSLHLKHGGPGKSGSGDMVVVWMAIFLLEPKIK